MAKAALEGNGDDMDVDGEGDADVIDWGIKPLARQKEVERAWEDAVGLLPILKKVREERMFTPPESGSIRLLKHRVYRWTVL